MINVVLFVLLSGIAVHSVQGQTTKIPVLNVNKSIEYYDECSLSGNNFNARCVLASCPNLSGKCPDTTTGCSEISPLLSQCLQQPEAVICNLRVAHVPMCPLLIKLKGLTNEVSGNCSLKAGATFTDGLQNATFCVTGSGGGADPLSVSFSASNISSYGYYDCTFVLANYTLRAPAVDVVLTIDISATAAIDLKKEPITVDTKLDRSNISLFSADFNGLPQVLIDILVSAASEVLTASEMAQDMANFLSRYAASALRTSCAKN